MLGEAPAVSVSFYDCWLFYFQRFHGNRIGPFTWGCQCRFLLDPMPFCYRLLSILRRSADGVKAMQAFGKVESESIALGYIPTAFPSFLTEALRKFSDQYPKTAVHLRELTPQEQVEALRAEKIDLAFIGSSCPEL